jgi:hypothetical protein
MRTTTERRLRRLAERRLEPDERIVTCVAVWYARPVRFHQLAARYRDYAVLTDQRLMLWEAGWITRRARRRVLADRLTDLTVTDLDPPRRARLRCDHAGHPPFVLELDGSERARTLADAITAPRSAATPVDTQL